MSLTRPATPGIRIPPYVAISLRYLFHMAQKVSSYSSSSWCRNWLKQCLGWRSQILRFYVSPSHFRHCSGLAGFFVWMEISIRKAARVRKSELFGAILGMVAPGRRYLLSSLTTTAGWQFSLAHQLPSSCCCYTLWVCCRGSFAYLLGHGRHSPYGLQPSVFLSLVGPWHCGAPWPRSAVDRKCILYNSLKELFWNYFCLDLNGRSWAPSLISEVWFGFFWTSTSCYYWQDLITT